MELEERIARLEQCMETQGQQLSYIMEQVTLGKHVVTFAKLMGWVIGVAATSIEVWRSIKGN
jgi:hypothetical protein